MVGVAFEAESEAFDTTGIVFFVFVRVRPMAESQVRLIKFSVALAHGLGSCRQTSQHDIDSEHLIQLSCHSQDHSLL